MEQGTDDQDKKTDWAEARTEWAEDRTVLANERTFAGWMRTGMGAIAVALGLKAVFSAAEAPWIPKTVASAFILAAVVIFWAARTQACRSQSRLDTHDAKAQSTTNFTMLSTIFIVSAIATGAILWTL
ncbi:MAG: DUF202 domain-containing protein [Pseudomonadota bacterium]